MSVIYAANSPYGLNPLEPRLSTIFKLANLVVHLQEHRDHGDAADLGAIAILEADVELETWFDALTSIALLPVKRRRGTIEHGETPNQECGGSPGFSAEETPSPGDGGER